METQPVISSEKLNPKVDETAEKIVSPMNRLSLSTSSNSVGDEKAPQLPHEIEEGNIEYKRKLVNPTPDRLKRLVSQCKWRLTEGSGEAIYEIGVEDDGTPSGLNSEELDASISTLEKIGKELSSDITVLRKRDGISGKVAEVLIRRYVPQEFN